MRGIRKCPSQKYRDTGIPRYFVTPSIVVDNFCKNPTVRIVCSALADFSHNCVNDNYNMNFLPLDMVVRLLAF